MFYLITQAFHIKLSKVDTIDSENLTISFTVFEGDILKGILDSVTHHMKFIISTGGGSTYKHTVLYKCKGDNKLKDDDINLAKESVGKTFKAVEAFNIANPTAY